MIAVVRRARKPRRVKEDVLLAKMSEAMKRQRKTNTGAYKEQRELAIRRAKIVLTTLAEALLSLEDLEEANDLAMERVEHLWLALNNAKTIKAVHQRAIISGVHYARQRPGVRIKDVRQSIDDEAPGALECVDDDDLRKAVDEPDEKTGLVKLLKQAGFPASISMVSKLLHPRHR